LENKSLEQVAPTYMRIVGSGEELELTSHDFGQGTPKLLLKACMAVTAETGRVFAS
jgi:hypothetical protein